MKEISIHINYPDCLSLRKFRSHLPDYFLIKEDFDYPNNGEEVFIPPFIENKFKNSEPYEGFFEDIILAFKDPYKVARVEHEYHSDLHYVSVILNPS